MAFSSSMASLSAACTVDNAASAGPPSQKCPAMRRQIATFAAKNARV